MWLIVLLAAWGSGAAAQAKADFRDLWAACDEQRTCWAFGFTEDGSDPSGFVRIERGGEPQAAPTAILGVGLWEEALRAPSTSMRVSVDGVGTLVAGAREAEDGNAYVAELGDVRAASALVSALLRGRKLELQLLNGNGWTEPAVVSLDGASAAALWMDERQKRVETPTALVRRGAKPASTIPPVPRPRVVRAARPVVQGRLPAAWPAFVLQQPEVRACHEELSSDILKQVETARLDARTLLWSVTCSQGAYQASTLYFLGDEQGRGWRRARFDPPPPQGEEMYVMNGGFDAETMTLSAFNKGRGISDCGTFNEWVWTGEAFALVGETTMDHCRGVPWSYWPAVVRREVRR